MSKELTQNELVHKLAKHRTDNVDEKELVRLYYDDQHGLLSDYTKEELLEMVEAEMDES